MKIHGHPLSSCTRKVLVTLAEKGETAEVVVVDLFAHEHKQAAHLARHPFGVIPVFEEGAFALYESRAIIRYIDARFGGVKLTPSKPAEVARMDQWLSVDQSYVAPHTRTLAVERILKKNAGQSADAAAEKNAEDALRTAFSVFDRSLSEGGPYLAGESYSLADISLMPYVASLPMLGAERLLDGHGSLHAWWERVRARPAWQKAVAQG